MSTIPNNPLEKKTIGFDPNSKVLTWGITPDGDLITHKQLTDFQLYLLDLGLMEEGSPVVQAEQDVLLFVWNAYKDTKRLDYIYNIIKNHSPYITLNLSGYHKSIPTASRSWENFKKSKKYPVQRHCDEGTTKAPSRNSNIARGFFNSIQSLWQRVVK